jgi:hypothetical protein
MVKMINIVKNIKKETWILLAIILVGIFLRTYNFHDGLRFNADQARDATLVGEVINGETGWPLLGPKAGGTDFRLGPIFYEFQIIAGKIFGNYPDKLAYPDLFFSLLSIPLLFFFLKKYFSEKLALALTALFAVSFYAIKYAHFAWNPNSTPFWTMLFLYALLQLAESQGKHRIFWSVMAGVAVGVGVQLHTFLLVVMPLLTIAYFVYLRIEVPKKNNLWKSFMIVFVVSIFLNIPQLYNEAKTGGDNVKALFSGVTTKKEDENLLLKAGRVGECFMTATTFTISSVGESDQCNFLPVKTAGHIVDILLGGLLFLGGLGLGIWRLVKETSEDRKRFLGLILSYAGLMAFFMTPVAYELSLRYFLIITFLPFIFLGLWLEFLIQKFKNNEVVITLTIMIILIALNLWTVRDNFIALNNYTESSNMDGFDNVYLGELAMMANYITAQNNLSQDVLLDGNSQYLFKASKGLIYLTEKQGVHLQPLNKKNSVAGNIVFTLISTESKDNKIKTLEKNSNVLDFKSFGRFGLIKSLRN